LKSRIVIVEDEPAIAANYADMLSRQGYSVKTYQTKEAASIALQTSLPDLVVLDIGLGEHIDGGFDLCRDLRSHSPTLPIIILSARDSDYDVVAGLRMGADDFVSKDVSQQQLMARVSALLRRSQISEAESQESTLVRGELILNLDRMSAQWLANPVELTLTEFWMVHALARHPGHLRTRQQLMDAANVVLDENSITSHIKRIRHKFQLIDPDFDAIQTAYGMGYRWLGVD
jgi:two-component system OmpR family response regulator